jgi:hypothetical protein
VPPAAPTIRELPLSPSPVSDTTATMTPAAAHTATTGRTPRVPAARQSNTRLGVQRVSRRRNPRAKATTVAYSTARNGDSPKAMKTTIRTRELK